MKHLIDDYCATKLALETLEQASPTRVTSAWRAAYLAHVRAQEALPAGARDAAMAAYWRVWWNSPLALPYK